MTGIDADEFDFVPEQEHVENFFDGLLDTISGNESMTLTNAQVYMQAALFASGSLTRQQVTGNEGFFSKIGEGIKAAWDYIVKMFKSIYNAIFKKEVKDTGEKVKVKIKEAEVAIAAVEKPKVTPTNVEAVIKKVEAKVEHLPPSPQKTKLEEQVTTAKAAPEPEKVKSAIDLLEQVFDATLLDNKKLVTAAERLKGATGRLKARKDAYDKDDDHMGLDIQTYLNGLIGLPSVDTIKDMTSAKAFLYKAGRCMEAMGNSWMTIFNTEQHTQRIIDELGKEINEYSETDKNDKIRKEIETLKSYLSGVTEVHKITDTVTLSLITMCDVVSKACVVII